MNVSSATAANIRAALARRNIPQYRLAELIGENEMWVSRRLKQGTPIKVDDLVRIAAALDMDPVELLGREVVA